MTKYHIEITKRKTLKRINQSNLSDIERQD